MPLAGLIVPFRSAYPRPGSGSWNVAGPVGGFDLGSRFGFSLGGSLGVSSPKSPGPAGGLGGTDPRGCMSDRRSPAVIPVPRLPRSSLRSSDLMCSVLMCSVLAWRGVGGSTSRHSRPEPRRCWWTCGSWSIGSLSALGGRLAELTTRVFRHTWTAARLQTLDRGAAVSVHLGNVRHRSEVVAFRLEQHLEALKDRLGLVGFGTTIGTTEKAGCPRKVGPAPPAGASRRWLVCYRERYCRCGRSATERIRTVPASWIRVSGDAFRSIQPRLARGTKPAMA